MSGFRFSRSTPIDLVVESVARNGVAVIDALLAVDFLAQTRDAMFEAQAAIVGEVGRERLHAAGELGVLRLMMRYQAHFFRFLELPEALEVIDRTLAPTAVLHLQNGFILPSHQTREQPQVFQNTYHQDFPRVLNGYVASMNLFFAIDEFRRDNGATWVVPGSHHRAARPSADELAERAMPLECPAGSMIVFDSTLWHAAGANVSGHDRLAINHQFTRSWIKQQIDYVRALGDAAVLALPSRSQQLLGWYTRVPTRLDEYYRPPAERLYRGGQG
jgi:ectoine hydroxylase-related dioxygenase (phytanoyl-CoA dioxygenase family)